MSGSVSSQYISALLMIGPMLKNGLILKLIDKIVSRPYIDMTIAVMQSFGAKVGWKDENIIEVEPLPYQPCSYQVESDWSAASYWYEMVALSFDAEAEILLPGLFAQSLQGDSRGATVFEQLGVSTEHRGDEVVLRKNGKRVERLDARFGTDVCGDMLHVRCSISFCGFAKSQDKRDGSYRSIEEGIVQTWICD